MADIELHGCVPDRLLSYLSALGILRLVGRQADAAVRGWWRDNTFMLRTGLSRDELEHFFLDCYQPTPLLMPWNSGAFSSGKEASAAGKAMERLVSTTAPRFAPFRAAVEATRAVLREFEGTSPLAGKPANDPERKAALLWRCRNTLPDAVVEWIDAAVVLTSEDKPEYPPLLGSGGNDGRMDFTSNYMQRLADVLAGDVAPDGGRQRTGTAGQSVAWLCAALFADVEIPLLEASVGQFDPGSAGGPNASAGFSGPSLVNPWQYILALEGSMLLAAAATRRLGQGRDRLASIPFTVRTLAVGYASAAEAEALKKSRAELWLPTWQRPWTLSETEQVFNEGRLSIGGSRRRRQAGNAIDVACAISQLGIDRGIAAFHRFSFLQRSGNAYYAVCLGQMRAPQAPSGDVAVLEEIAEWHDQVRREAGSAGAGYRAVLQNLEKAMYSFAQAPQPERLDVLLRSLGRMEQSVARHAGGILRRGDRPRVRPLQGLTRHWVPAQPDAAVRIALALASIQTAGKRGEVGPIRGHLEPVARVGKSWGWGRHDDPTVVWGGDSLIGNLCALLERRVTEARAANLSPAPLSARFGVSAADIADFLRDDSGLNDGRIADLVWAFGGLTDAAWATCAKSHATRQAGDEQEPPNAYTLLKLALLPGEVTPPRGLGARSWPRRPQPFESRPIALLHAGRMAEAIELAGRRLRVEGLPPLATDFLYAGSAARLEAALLIPVCGAAIGHLERRVLQPPPDGGAA